MKTDPYRLMARLRADLPGNNWSLKFRDDAGFVTDSIYVTNDRVRRGEANNLVIPCYVNEDNAFLQCYDISDGGIKDCLGTWSANIEGEDRERRIDAFEAKKEMEWERDKLLAAARLERQEAVYKKPGKASHLLLQQGSWLIKKTKSSGIIAGKKAIHSSWPRGAFDEAADVFDFGDLGFRSGVRLSDDEPTIAERVGGAYERACADFWSRQGTFLGDDLDLTYTDRNNGWKHFGMDRSGHSGRV